MKKVVFVTLFLLGSIGCEGKSSRPLETRVDKLEKTMDTKVLPELNTLFEYSKKTGVSLQQLGAETATIKSALGGDSSGYDGGLDSSGAGPVGGRGRNSSIGSPDSLGNIIKAELRRYGVKNVVVYDSLGQPPRVEYDGPFPKAEQIAVCLQSCLRQYWGDRDLMLEWSGWQDSYPKDKPLLFLAKAWVPQARGKPIRQYNYILFEGLPALRNPG